MKSSVQLASIALSAAVGLYAAFIIVCLMPQKSEFPVPGEIGGEKTVTLASASSQTDSTVPDASPAPVSKDIPDLPSEPTIPTLPTSQESSTPTTIPETPPTNVESSDSIPERN